MQISGTPFHIEVLSRELQRRKERNPRYSLRAFAHQLEMEPSALSRILAGKQQLSLRATRRVAELLKLEPAERDAFFASVTDSLKSRATVYLTGLSKDDGSKTKNDSSVPATEPWASATLQLDPEKLGDIKEIFRTFAKSLEKVYGGGTQSIRVVLHMNRLESDMSPAQQVSGLTKEK